uniref:C2H2-type domain-containing protein n=1 Tax=Cyanothece sp. (strain PCC 7425 / ATCC 29141) TaxID=395961 RepID=B8HSX4_CYAP4
MKYIEKGEEPSSFTGWKAQKNENWEPTWDNLQAPQKPELHEALLFEQGYICCYCGMRISKTNSHIEHLKPRSHFPELALDYNNLLSSCPGEGDEKIQSEATKLKHLHCGVGKDDWYDPTLMVSPLAPNCTDYFSYTAFGEILAATDLTLNAAALETIKRLRLDHSKLTLIRRRAIEAIIPLDDDYTQEEIETLIESYSQRNEKGEFVRFYAAVIYILKQLI